MYKRQHRMTGPNSPYHGWAAVAGVDESPAGPYHMLPDFRRCLRADTELPPTSQFPI